MKYPKVVNLVPKDEYFDDTAVNEGVWLSAGHLNAIENQLGVDATELSARGANITSLTGELAAANTARIAAENSLATANGTIQTQNARIVELEKKPATDITNTTKAGADKLPGEAADEKSAYMTSVDEEVIHLRKQLGY